MTYSAQRGSERPKFSPYFGQPSRDWCNRAVIPSVYHLASARRDHGVGRLTPRT